MSRSGPVAVKGALKQLEKCKKKECKEKKLQMLRRAYNKSCTGRNKGDAMCKKADRTLPTIPKKATKKGYKFHPVYGNLRY